MMHCPRCEYDNSANAKFCQECGHSFQPSAPSRREPRSYTPRHLAEKILVTRGALEGERKQVTVLFADIKGSMEIAEQIDPEDWHRIMERFFAILSEGIHRFEGTINQYTGDGVMALFGAPIAHEDHAQRACYAALTLHDHLRQYADELRLTVGLSFSVRMGLNSGEVVVGRIGDDLRMDYTAQGPTVGLAARMEQIAAPDSVYLTEHTARLVEGFFTLRDLGSSTVKGVARPLHVFELQSIGRIRTRLDAASSRGLARFVGRSEEQATLDGALEQARMGAGRVVGVVGQPGVGKSRLCLEFIQRCRTRGISVYEAHCPSHGKAVPLLPVLELLRGLFGISERDGAHEARRKIAGELLLLDRQFEETLPIVFDFLGVPDADRPVPRMDPERRQSLLFECVRRLVRARSERAHAVVLVDDVHWIDPGSDAFLAELVAAVAGTRTLVLLNFRPEYHADWMQLPYYVNVSLDPLGEAAARELVESLLGNGPSVAALPDLIRKRTAGNPFFIEEVIQALADSGVLAGVRGAYQLVGSVDELQIPGTVQAVLGARIDRLSEEDKRVLQTAAVVGKRFSEAVLLRIVDLAEGRLRAALDRLDALDFIRSESVYPELEYAFKHPLTQEVAYRSQLTDARRRVHAAVADALIDLEHDRVDEHAALIAHHWGAAGDALQAARWHLRAADWSRLRDHVEALRQSRMARELLLSVPESEERLALRMNASLGILGNGWRTGISEEEAAAVFAEGKELATQAESPVFLALVYAGYGQMLGSVGRIADNLQLGQEAEEFVRTLPDAGIRLVLAMAQTAAENNAGLFRAAQARIERALAAAPDDFDAGASIIRFSPLLFLIYVRGWLCIVTGHLRDGLADVRRVRALAEAREEHELIVMVEALLVDVATFLDDHDAALHHARHAFQLAERIGSPTSVVEGYRALGIAQLAHDPRAARDAFERGLTISRARRLGMYAEPTMLAQLAEACVQSGEVDRALTLADEACAVGRRVGIGWQEARALCALARVLTATGGAGARERSDAARARAIDLYLETGALFYLPAIQRELAAAARMAGDEDAAGAWDEKARKTFAGFGVGDGALRLADLLAD